MTIVAEAYATMFGSSGMREDDLTIDEYQQALRAVELGEDAQLQRRNPSDIRIAALLRKDRPGASDIPVDWLGFDIPDEFVVGYGLDFDEQYRNLPFIGVVGE